MASRLSTSSTASWRFAYDSGTLSCSGPLAYNPVQLPTETSNYVQQTQPDTTTAWCQVEAVTDYRGNRKERRAKAAQARKAKKAAMRDRVIKCDPPAGSRVS